MSFEFQGKGFGGAGTGKGFGKNGGGFSAGGGEDNPLDEVEYTGYVDEDLHEQMTALQKGFEDRAKKERDRFKRATDPNFWFAVYFPTREEKEAFLNAMRIMPSIYGDRYIDGRKWAKQAGIELKGE